ILEALSYLQGQITGIPQGLVYKGTWNASTNTPTLASGTGTTGEFYIVSVAGTTNLDGITDWQVGDWAIFVEVGATDTWQKIDNTSAILGSGTANKIAKWTGSNTLATGLISDDGTDVTIGNSGNLVVEGNTTLGDANTDTTTIKGLAIFEERIRINEGISLGVNTYGTAGQVLTSGGGPASVNTWTTPTTGTVTSVIAGTGITIGGTAADPTVAIDYLGTDNAILSAPLENGIATTDTVWFSDATDDNIKKTTVANLLALDGARSLSAVLAVGNTSGANNILMADSQSVNFGAGNDLIITHDGTNSIIGNVTGNLYIRNDADDADIVFQSDDGSGGRAIYFQLDGSQSQSRFLKDVKWDDDIKAKFGTSDDLRIYHDATDSFIENNTGDLFIRQNADDADIYFQSDNGSGGRSTYMYLDGSITETRFTVDTRHNDNIKAKFGDAQDLQIYHDGSNSYISNNTGVLYIDQNPDNGNVIFRNDDGSGGLAEYILLDGGNGAVKLKHYGTTKFETTTNGVTVLGQGLLMEGTSSPQEAVLTMGTANNTPTIKMMNIGNNYIYSPNGNVVLRTGGTPVDGLRVSGSTVFLSQYGQGNLLPSDPSSPPYTGYPTYDLAVSNIGKVLEVEQAFPYQKSGIFNGDKAVITSAVREAFVLKRATTGTLIFDVWFTSETSTATSVAKKYVVAHSNNTTPVYNKILDTGPDGSNDFTVTFANATGDATGDSVQCNIQAVGVTQNIGYTVQVGYDSVNTLTFTPS
ncbi:MAG: hypothetical protein ACR2M9_03495, partial [Cyanophyceae cyanobacterium]